MQRLFPGIFYGWFMVGGSLAINVAISPLNAVVFSFLIGPISADLDVSKSALGWALTLRLIFAGLTGPLYGMVLDRYGARWLGAAGGAIGGISLMILGGLHSIWFIYAIFAFSGLAGFGAGAAGQLLTQVPLAKWFVAHRGRAISIATAGMALGTVFMIPLTQWLIEAVGWRSTTMILGTFVAGIVVPVSILVFRRAPEDMGLFPDGAATRPSETVAVDPRLARLTTTQDWTVQQALRTPALWLTLTAMTLAGVSLMGTLVYRVDFWQSTGMPPALVGLGTALDPLCVVFSLLAFGVVADRMPIRYIGFIGVAGLALSMVPMVVSTGQAWTILAHNAIWGISAAGWITLNSLIWPNYFGRQRLGAIRGIMLPVSIAASSAGPPLFGYLLDGPMTPSQVWIVGLLGFVAAAVLVLFARPPRPLIAAAIAPARVAPPEAAS